MAPMTMIDDRTGCSGCGLHPTAPRHNVVDYPPRNDLRAHLIEDSASRYLNASSNFIVPPPRGGGSQQQRFGGTQGSDCSRRKCRSPHYRSRTPVSTIKQGIIWESCDNFGVTPSLPGLYCSHAELPMDYHDTSAGTAKLAVIKYTTAEPGKKKGSIFINPGEYSRDALKITPLIYPGKVVLAGLEPLHSLHSRNP